MSALRLLACLGAAAAAATGWADPPPAPGPLTWQLPCTFRNADGAVYSKSEDADDPSAPIPYYECDYVQAHDPSAAQEFNALPPERQQAFLKRARAAADAAFRTYHARKTALLRRTDPESLETIRDPEKRVDRLLRYKSELQQQEGAIAAPFESAMLRTHPPLTGPLSPYRQEFFDRQQDIQDALQKAEPALTEAQRSRVAKIQADFDDRAGRTAAAELKKASDELAGDGADKARLDALFTGSRDPASSPAPGAARLGAGSSPGGMPGGAALADETASKYSRPPSNPPPPKPSLSLLQNLEHRGYFDSSDYDDWRKYGDPAGWRRVRDDAKIEWQHWSGQSRTIGDPDGKLAFSYEQLHDASCANASQRMALQARGVDLSEEALDKEATRKRYYSPAESRLYDANDAGTTNAFVGALARDHGFKVTSKENASPRQIDAAIRKYGDAIVGVDSGSFYKKTSFQDGDHEVYVTGMEVDTKTNKTLGYYVNDPGTGEGKRFVSAADFNRAWDKTLVTVSDKPVRRPQP